MLSIDKDKFFTDRQLPSINYRYIYNCENYEVPLEDVICSIGKTEEKCLFLLNELKASDDFLVNVYLQDLADERMQNFLRSNLYDEISASMLDDHKNYKFQLNAIDYIAYQDDEERYHVDKVDEVGKYNGWARHSRFVQHLIALINAHTFDCQRIGNRSVS